MVAASFYISSAIYESFNFSTFLPHSFPLFYDSYPSGYEVIPHVFFIFISLGTNDVKHLFLCSSVICMSSLENYSSHLPIF